MKSHIFLSYIGVYAAFATGITTHAPGLAKHAAAIPQVRRSTTYYELGATTIADLITEFQAAAGKGGIPVRFGLTKWDITFTTSPTFGTRTSCSTQFIALHVAITATLPKTTRITHFTTEEAVEWQRFLTALRRHEAQHDSIVVAQATTFLQQVETDANHSGAQIGMDQCVADILERIERASIAFDATTHHGATDGAALRVIRVGLREPSSR